jgi:hypothetical protein
MVESSGNAKYPTRSTAGIDVIVLIFHTQGCECESGIITCDVLAEFVRFPAARGEKASKNLGWVSEVGQPHFAIVTAGAEGRVVFSGLRVFLCLPVKCLTMGANLVHPAQIVAMRRLDVIAASRHEVWAPSIVICAGCRWNRRRRSAFRDGRYRLSIKTTT